MRKNAGQKILEHDQLRLDMEDDVIEYRRLMEPDIMASVRDTAEKARNHDLYKKGDFYIVLAVVMDRVLRSPRYMCFARKSCPTPVYRTSVWKYRRSLDDIEFLFCLPDGVLYHHIVRNAPQYLQDKECSQLAQFVLLDHSGELLEWVKKENGEKVDAVININKENPCLIN